MFLSRVPHSDSSLYIAARLSLSPGAAFSRTSTARQLPHSAGAPSTSDASPRMSLCFAGSHTAVPSASSCLSLLLANVPSPARRVPQLHRLHSAASSRPNPLTAPSSPKPPEPAPQILPHFRFPPLPEGVREGAEPRRTQAGSLVRATNQKVVRGADREFRRGGGSLCRSAMRAKSIGGAICYSVSPRPWRPSPSLP